MAPIAITHSSHQSTRIPFATKKVRDEINRFVKAKGKLLPTEQVLISNIHPCINDVFKWLIGHFLLGTNPVNTVPRGIMTFLQCVGSASPVCSYLFPSEENIGLVKSLCKDPITNDFRALRTLQNELPIFYGLLTAVKGYKVLPPCFQALIEKLCNCAEAPFDPSYYIPDTPAVKTAGLDLT